MIILASASNLASIKVMINAYGIIITVLGDLMSLISMFECIQYATGSEYEVIVVVYMEERT